MSKRNLAANFVHCLRTWGELRRYPGVFTLKDAFATLSGVVLPMRIADSRAKRRLALEARIEKVTDGVHKVMLPDQGLSFYWLGSVDSNLYWTIAQEFDPEFPHNYTTPPVQLTNRSVVLDVGACEGLFAFRAIKQLGVARVICFEPSPRVAEYTIRGAKDNEVADRLVVEQKAVSDKTGVVNFEESHLPDGSRITSGPGSAAASRVECVRLDDYCAANNIRLGREDLIKIDAEGADLDVLRGAERLIREGGPQIAVTTYHDPNHAIQMIEWLRKIQPGYRLRLKGFASWTPKPTPVLLQAALRT